MASSDNLMTMEPWAFRSAFNDSWFPEMFAKETETLTKVLLQTSFPAHGSDVPVPPVEAGSPFSKPEPTLSFQGPTASSENETAASNRLRVANKKIAKRKPRASKRASTTYITADVDSFRHMVQQVTGVRTGHLPVASVLKPEPRRPAELVQQTVVSCLPTLDTSAFLLDPTPSYVSPPIAPPADVAADGGFGFDCFADFPTLESWERVMQ